MRLRRISTVLAGAIVAAACSGSTDGPGLADDFSVAAALAEIPASATADAGGSPIQVAAADLDRAAAQAGVERPSDSTDSDELVAFLGPLTGLARADQPLRVFVPLPRIFTDRTIVDLDEFVAELGFSPGDVRSFVALETPPAQFIVATGVAAPSGLPEVAPNVTTVGEGEDFEQDLGTLTAARPLGRPLRVAEASGRLGLSLATPPLVDWVGGSVGGTLADDPALSAVANRLDEEEMVSALLVAGDAGLHLATGLGWAADDEGARGVIVFAFASEQLAQDSLELIEGSFAGESLVTGQPIADLVTAEAVAVRGSEIVAVVRFPDGRRPGTTLDMLLRRDGPFAGI